MKLWNTLYYVGIFGTALMTFATLSILVEKGITKDFFVNLSSLMIVGIIPLLLGYFKRRKIQKLQEEIQKAERITSLLRLAKTKNGMLSISEVSLELGISVDEARNRLEEAVSKGVCRIELDEKGNLDYIFPDLLKN